MHRYKYISIYIYIQIYLYIDIDLFINIYIYYSYMNIWISLSNEQSQYYTGFCVPWNFIENMLDKYLQKLQL